MLVIPTRVSRSGVSRTVFIEFKRPGVGPKPHQELVHAELRREGLTVWAINDTDVFTRLLEELLHATA